MMPSIIACRPYPSNARGQQPSSGKTARRRQNAHGMMAASYTARRRHASGKKATGRMAGIVMAFPSSPQANRQASWQ